MKQNEILITSEQSCVNNRRQLSRCIRFTIFILFLLLSISRSADLGIIGSSSKIIKFELNFDDKEFAFFASNINIGFIIGTLVYMLLLKVNNIKCIIIPSLIINGALYFIFFFTKNKMILYAMRIILGTLNALPQVYFPIWIDQYGIKSLKTIMLTLFNISTLMGQVIGFSIGSLQEPSQYKWFFAYIGISIGIIGLMILFIPSLYFANNVNFIGYDDGENIINETNERTKGSIFNINSQNSNEKSFCSLLTNPTFIFNAMTVSSFLFILQIIHLFLADYVSYGLHFSYQYYQKKLLHYYSICTLLGPSLGGLFGGIVTTQFGGYEKKSSIIIVIIFGTILLIVSTLIAFARTILFISVMIFLFFFFSSASLPTINGYIISSIPQSHKSSGFALSTLLTTLLGTFSGPICYGYINDKMKDREPTFAWKCSMFYYYVGYATMLFGCLFRYRDIIKKKEPAFIRSSSVSGYTSVLSGSHSSVRKDDELELQNLKD